MFYSGHLNPNQKFSTSCENFFLKSLKNLNFYLAQKLCFWTGIIFVRVYVSVCVSVCLSVSLFPDYLKKFLTDFDEIWQDDVLW